MVPHPHFILLTPISPHHHWKITVFSQYFLDKIHIYWKAPNLTTSFWWAVISITITISISPAVSQVPSYSIAPQYPSLTPETSTVPAVFTFDQFCLLQICYKWSPQIVCSLVSAFFQAASCLCDSPLMLCVSFVVHFYWWIVLHSIHSFKTILNIF